MPNTQVRVVGSGFSSFSYQGQPIAFLEGVDDSGQRAFSDAGQGYQFIHPLGQRHPVEIATSRVLAGGTLNLTIRELWSGWVWEQLQGLAGTNNIVDVFDVLAANPAYVTCQTVIQPPGNAAPRGKNYMNCLHSESRYVTQSGVKTIGETIGTTQMVMSSRGWWTPAEIRDFGEQEIWSLKLRRGTETKEVLVTADHRWFVQGRRPQRCYATETFTRDLQSGQKLVSVYQPNQLGKLELSPQGIQAGIVFGDGGLQGRARNMSGVSLYGEKLADLLKWFPHNTTSVAPRAQVDGLNIYGMPRSFKAAPDLGEGLGYLYGWLAGYFATDGHMDKNGFASISSVKKDNLELVRDVCQLLGIPTAQISRDWHERQAPYKSGWLYRVSIPTSALTEEFFLRNSQYERALPRLTDETPYEDWVVDSVGTTGITEQVGCAVVPQGHAFVLEDNILTGNCTIVDISDNDTITVGALAVTKGIVVAYTHSTSL